MNNKRTFLVHVVEEYKAYRVGSRIVEAHTPQEAKALAKDFKENGDLVDYWAKSEGEFDEAYENMGASVECHTTKSKMSIVELDENGTPIERPKFRPSAHYVSASTGEII